MLARLLGVVDIVIPLDDNLAAPAVSAITGRDPPVSAQMSLLEFGSDDCLIPAIALDLELALARHIAISLGLVGSL